MINCHIVNMEHLRSYDWPTLNPSHPNHGLFQLLTSGKWYHSLKAQTSSLWDSFFRQAITYEQ